MSNADLIAAFDVIAAREETIAELREALVGIVRTYRHDWTAPDPPELVKARAALALAEGTHRQK